MDRPSAKDTRQKLAAFYKKKLAETECEVDKEYLELLLTGSMAEDIAERNAISEKLTRKLLQPRGIVNLFRAVVDFDETSQKSTTLNQRFIALSRIITHLPKIIKPYDEFCIDIVKQLKPLFLSDSVRNHELAGIMMVSLIYSPHARPYKNLSSAIVDETLLKQTQNTTTNQDEIQPDEYRLEESIIATYNLLDNSRFPSAHFTNHFPQFFYCALTLYRTPSRYKSMLIYIMKQIVNQLKGLKHGSVCCLFENTLIHEKHWAHQFELKVEDDGISITRCYREVIDGSQWLHADTMIDIQSIVFGLIRDDDELLLNFCFHFREAMLWSARDEQSRTLCANLIEPLLEDSEMDMLGKERSQPKRGGKSLISAMIDNHELTANLISRTLINYLTYLRTSDDHEFVERKLVERSIISCLDILKVLLLLPVSDKTASCVITERCLPTLEQIKGLKRTDARCEVIENIDSLIETIRRKADSAPCPRIEEELKKKNQCELDGMIGYLNCAQVPNRVHALIRLKQFVIANDKRALDLVLERYSILEATLADPESYVYLACINLMVEIALRDTNSVLPKLIELYQNNSGEYKLQHRMNVGEVLMRLIKQLNETTPHYAKQIMRVFIDTCCGQKCDELMRASSLTNMGELCKRLGESLGSYILDILGCVDSVLVNDCIEVKCAAVDLLRTALSGLDRKKGIESMQHELGRVYKTLKFARQRTLDDTFCLQVDLALDEIDRIAKELILGHDGSAANQSDEMVKSINITSLLR